MQIFPKIIKSDGEGDYPALNDVEFTIDEKRLLALQKILIRYLKFSLRLFLSTYSCCKQRQGLSSF